MPEELRLELKHLTLAARRWNPGAPLRALALHGWLDNAASFDRLAPYLTQVELVALDLPGHGKSDWRPPGAFYHFIDAVADVIEVIEVLGWEHLSLVGHSLGAGLAPLAAAALGARVESLVCVEGLGPYTSPDEEAPDLLRRSLAQTLGGSPPVYADWEAVLERLQQRGIGPEAAEALASRGARAVEGGFSFIYDARLRWASRARLSEAQVRAFLGQVGCPLLLVEANQGIKRFWAERRQCVRQLYELEAVGGHHLHLDDPGRIQAPIHRFLQERSL